MNLRVAGQYTDDETTLAENGFRTYDGKLRGGYIQADPVGLSGGLNRYVYADANPLAVIDPTGEFGVLGAALGAGTELAIQLALNGGDLKCVDWWAVGIGGLTGAIGGAALGKVFRLPKGKMNWKNVRRRYRRAHDVPATEDVHHWAIEKNGSFAKAIEKTFGTDVKNNIVNHPANLNPIDRATHQGLHNAFGPLARWWYGTPAWAQAAEGSIAAGAAGELQKDCTCR